MRARQLGPLTCYIMVIPGIRLENMAREVVVADGEIPCEDLTLRIPVWAYSPLDAMDRIGEGLTDLIEAENSGEIARVPDDDRKF